MLEKGCVILCVCRVSEQISPHNTQDKTNFGKFCSICKGLFAAGEYNS